MKVIRRRLYPISDYLNPIADGFDPIADRLKVIADGKEVSWVGLNDCGTSRVPVGANELLATAITAVEQAPSLQAVNKLDVLATRGTLQFSHLFDRGVPSRARQGVGVRERAEVHDRVAQGIARGGATYDFFAQLIGRRSIDGNGMRLDSQCITARGSRTPRGGAGGFLCR